MQIENKCQESQVVAVEEIKLQQDIYDNCCQTTIDIA